VEYLCKKCGECCRSFYFKLGLDETLIQFLKFRNKPVLGIFTMIKDSEGKDILKLEIPVACQWLREDNLCDKYEERPEWCRRYYCGRYRSP